MEERIERIKGIIGTDRIIRTTGYTRTHIYNLFKKFKKLWLRGDKISKKEHILISRCVDDKFKELEKFKTEIKNDF